MPFRAIRHEACGPASKKCAPQAGTDAVGGSGSGSTFPILLGILNVSELTCILYINPLLKSVEQSFVYKSLRKYVEYNNSEPPMVRKKGPGRKPVEEQTEVLSVRISPATKWRLAKEAARNKRRLSKEVQARLGWTLSRYGTKPSHIADLAELMALTAQAVERRTGKAWDQDRDTAERLIAHLITAITRLISHWNKEVAPPKASPDDPGMLAAAEVIAFSEAATVPSGWDYAPERYVPGGRALWKIQRNLSKRHK